MTRSPAASAQHSAMERRRQSARVPAAGAAARCESQGRHRHEAEELAAACLTTISARASGCSVLPGCRRLRRQQTRSRLCQHYCLLQAALLPVFISAHFSGVHALFFFVFCLVLVGRHRHLYLSLCWRMNEQNRMQRSTMNLALLSINDQFLSKMELCTLPNAVQTSNDHPSAQLCYNCHCRHALILE